MLLRFENPEWLWALLSVGGLVYLMLRQGHRYPATFSARRTWTAGTAFTLCVLALARPQLGHQTTESRSTRFNLFLAIDISRSMMADDISPTRLQFAVAFCQRLLEQIPGARVALYPFASDGFLQMPLSQDLNAAAELLAALDPSMTSHQGTDFTASLQTLLDRIRRMEADAGRLDAGWAPPQVLLFSDGESHEAVSQGVLREFRSARIPVHTVGVGTPGGTNLIIPRNLGNLGFPEARATGAVRTKLETASLLAIAQETGGHYFPASFGELGRVTQRLTQSLQMGSLSVKFRADQELFPFLLGLAFLLFCLEFSLGRWQYAIRALTLFALLCGLNRGAHAEGDDDLELILDPPLPEEVAPPPPPPEPKMDDRTRAVYLYNKALEDLSGGKLDKAAERFQEAAYLSPDKTVKKKALFNLGNTYLRAADPQQALHTYQEAYDTRSDEAPFEKEANLRISENIALATRMMQQMAGQSSQDQDGAGNENDDRQKKGEDPGGPQKDYQPQNLSPNQKKKIFETVASEEQQILRRLMEKNQRKRPTDPNAKPW